MAGFSQNPDTPKLTVVNGSDTLFLPDEWCRVVSMFPLWFLGPPREDTEIVPHVDGEVATHSYQGAALITLQLILRGDVLYDGTTSATNLRGMMANVEWLKSFCTPSSNGTPLELPATLSMTDEADRTANVRLELIEPDLAISHGRLSMLVKIASGGFT